MPYTVDQVMGYAAFKGWPGVTYRCDEHAVFGRERIEAGESSWREWQAAKPYDAPLENILDELRGVVTPGLSNRLANDMSYYCAACHDDDPGDIPHGPYCGKATERSALEAAGFRLSPPQPRTPLPPLKPMRQVRYVDSAYKSEQSPDVIGVCHIVAVGFVIADEADHLTLAREDLTDGTWRDQLAIPKCAIVEIREVVPK